MYNIPKAHLVRIICKNISTDVIRDYFSIKQDTLVESRLHSFSIADLDKFIITVNDKKLFTTLEKYAEDFPLKTSPTLYILNIAKNLDYAELEKQSKIFSQLGREAAIPFENTQTVNAVYTRFPLRILEKESVAELTLSYEKIINYTECDPNDEHFSETKSVYSLENAIAWFPIEHSTYAIIACCDFSAVNSLIYYLNKIYNLFASLPDLTEEMLLHLSEGGTPKNATFSLADKSDDIDVHNVTLFDSNLFDSKTFEKIRASMGSTQRSGYYADHPSLLRAGIGITRKYGRIWTPAHLDKHELIRLAIGSLSILDEQLIKVVNTDLKSFISYYSNANVSIEGYSLHGKPRKLFDDLICYLATAKKENKKSITVRKEFLVALAENYNYLKLIPYITGECPNCGEFDYKCPSCKSLYTIKVNKERGLDYKCPKCETFIIPDSCECEVHVPIIDIYSSIKYIPTIELVNAINEYATYLHPKISFPDLFIIRGNELLIINHKEHGEPRIITLNDLQTWQRGHFPDKLVVKEDSIKFIKIAREKCEINSWHPSKEDCARCFDRQLQITDFENAKVCLLRVFGIPINKKFDGVHHGREIADVKYSDSFDGNKHELAIHVKSIERAHFVNGLGRSNEKIKGLYSQIFYSLFQITEERLNIDTLGIAIPNKISPDVIKSMEEIVIKMGYSFLVIQKDEWEKIAQLAINEVMFDYAPSNPSAQTTSR